MTFHPLAPTDRRLLSGMDQSITLARHFARLVWLFLNDAPAFEAQLATLRALVVCSSTHGPVRIATRDWRLVVENTVVPERFTGTPDLTAQLIGHSVSDLIIERNASPADLLCVARLLAREPVPGDGGQDMRARLTAMDASTVHVHVAAPQELERKTPRTGASVNGGAAPDELSVNGADGMTAAFDTVVGGSEQNATIDAADDEDVVRSRDAEALFAFFSSATTQKASARHLFEGLDAARTSPEAAAQLDGLAKLATESARRGRVDMVADAFFGIADRERAIEDKVIRRQYALAIRRLASPSVMKCIVELLPKRKENYEQYMAILVRADESGVESLVDALVSAPSLSDRRVYFDSLLRLRTGVKTLIHMLGDPRWYVARNAVELLGDMRVSDAEADLTRMLEHKDDRVRMAAAGALAKLGGTAAAKGVLGVMKDASPEARERAMEALNAGQHGSVDALAKAIDREEDNRVLTTMIAALGQLGTPEAVLKLTEVARTDRGLLARNRPTPLRVAAVHALAETQSGAAWSALQTLLRDKEKSVRGAASWVLLGRKREGNATPRGSDDVSGATPMLTPAAGERGVEDDEAAD